MIDTDQLRERLRERVTEPADDYTRGECKNCGAQLTTEDVDNGACTQCGDGIPEQADDESVDEHLFDD